MITIEPYRQRNGMFAANVKRVTAVAPYEAKEVVAGKYKDFHTFRKLMEKITDDFREDMENSPFGEDDGV